MTTHARPGEGWVWSRAQRSGNAEPWPLETENKRQSQPEERVMWQFGLLVLVGFLVVGFLIWHAWQEKQRRQAIAELAQSLGLDFFPESDIHSLSIWQQVPFFNRGQSHKLLNHLKGETDTTAIHIFDFRFVVGNGKNSHTHQQTVVAMLSEDLQAPAFELSPESLFHRLGEWFGMQDIDFDDHPEFSRKFVLRAEDEAQVRQFMDRPLLDFLSQKPDIHLAVRPQELCLFRPNVRVPPEKWKELMGEAYEIFHALLACVERQGGTGLRS